MAEALLWADYAVPAEDFHELAADYFVTGDTECRDRAALLPGRFGPDRLIEGLDAFRQWYVEMSGGLASVGTSVAEWIRTQERTIKLVSRMKREGQLRGASVWLFSAPFKILADVNPESWTDPAIDQLLLPTGTQVEAAIEILEKDGVIERDAWSKRSGGPKAKEWESFDEALGRQWARHQTQVELALLAGSRALHINSGLRLLGTKDR